MNPNKQPVECNTIYLDYDEEYTLLELEEMFQSEAVTIKEKKERPTFFKVACDVEWDGDETNVNLKLICYRWEAKEEQKARVTQEILAEKVQAEHDAEMQKEKEVLLADIDFQTFQTLYSRFAVVKSKHKL